ncbi:MAG: leucine-rich repeat protein, partial [Clostridia bacterium]|nr:leucine-rich repeat protein [Clostridia bacterium]
KHIGNYAFRSAIFGQYVGEDLQINQTDFVIPGNVETIGDYAFFSVDGLKDLVIEEGVTTIGEYAFSNTSIQSIYIPASVSAIGVGILNNCPNLTSIIVSDDNPYFTSKDADGIQCNAIISKDTTSQVSTTSVNEMFTSVREAMPRATTTSWAPNTMIAIQQGLSEVTIPKGVEKIASGVFGNNITSITIPASITEIGDFSGYTGLESVIFAEGSQLTAIPENMFNGCTNLKSITIPASVTSIGTRAFYGCENLTNVYFEEGSKLTTIGSSVFYGCDMLEEITIPASVTTIGREAFLGGSSSGFNIYFEPGTQITTFLYRTFGSHVNMIIPASVTTIEKEAFYGCKGNITFENVEGWKYSNMEVSAGDLGCYGEAVKYLGTDYYGHQWTRTDIAGEIELNDSICELNAEQSYYIIKDGSSLSGEIIIPAMYKGLPVKEIGANAFKNNLNITKVTLPGTLLVIGDSAFYGCTNLTSVYMSHNVTTIGDSAFYMCSALDVEDSFSSSMKDIGNDAFAGCSSLTSAGLGRALKLTTIGDSAFAGCTKLNWFTSLSSTEFSIGSKAFENCTSLEEVYAYNLSELGDEAFVGCSALTDLYLNGAEITSIGYGVFKDCVNLNIATLPSTVTAIGDYAFYNCKSLNLTELSTDIKTIGNYAFYNCTALTADIPALVSTIGDYAFYGTSITTVNRLQAIETVGDYAFAGCTNLERFEFMPITLPRFGVHVFDGCESLIYKTYDNAYYLGQYDFNDACYLLVKAVNTNITSCTINTNAYIILDSAFEGCSNLTSISIPSATRYIGSNAFSGCTNLNSVTLEDRYYWEISNGENTQVILPSSLEDANAVAIAFIDVYCDYSWTKIEDVETFTLTYTEQPNSTMTILRNGEVYDGTEIKWGDVLTVTFTADEGYKIENYSFSNSEGTLEHKNGVIDVTSDITITYEVVEGITEEMLENGTLGDNWYTLNADGASYSVKKGGETLTDEVVIIGRKHKGLPVTAILDGTGTSSNGVFNNQMMDNIIIPNTVTSIGQFAFYGCTSLNSITIPNSVTTIGNDAFVRCWQMAEVIFEENSQLATIGNDTFSGCTALRSITIPQSVTSIDISAFKGCTQLHTVKFEENSMLTSLGTYVFENCEALTTINIPSALTTISQYTFSGCINLQNVQFDEESQLTTISSNAFYNCTGLQNLTIPKSVLKIEANAFYGCTGISSVTFGNTDNWIVELNGVVTNLYDEHLSNTTTAAGYLRSHLTEHTWEYIVYPEATLLDESWYQFDGSAFHVVRGTSGFPADGNVVIPKMFTKNGKTAPVVQIDAFAFNGNSNLVSITLPSTVKIIASQAFFQSSLTSINMTKGLETIASQAFAYCDELTSINLPSTVTTISERAFEYCLFLESAEISGNVGARAFDHCGSLQTVTLNANLGTIGEYAFAYCTKLTTVKNLGRVKTIEGYAFYNCEISSYSVYVSLSDVETIGEYAFAWNSLTLVRFGKNLKSVDPTAFYQNGSLEGIIVDSENTTYTSTYNGVECNAIIEI